MTCESWMDRILSNLYGELSPEEDAALATHLASCDACRRERDDLADARRMLQEAEAVVPAVPRVLVLAPRPRRFSALAFAAALAGIGLLTGVSLTWSWQARGLAAGLAGPAGSNRVAQPVPASDPVHRADLERWFEQRWAAAQERLQLPAAGNAEFAAQSTDKPLTRAEIQSILARLERKLDRNRARDLRYLLDEVAAAETRTGVRLGETQQAIRYLALASDPRISEQ